jgi:hypothetical protein
MPRQARPFSEAAPRLSKTPETLRKWHDGGHLPAVVSPGGQWATFESFINAVLASACPGRPGVIEEITRAWFRQREPQAAGLGRGGEALPRPA